MAHDVIYTIVGLFIFSFPHNLTFLVIVLPKTLSSFVIFSGSMKIVVIVLLDDTLN